MLGPYADNCTHSCVGRRTTQMMCVPCSTQLYTNTGGQREHRQLLVPKVPSAELGQGSRSKMGKEAGDCQRALKMLGLSSFAKNWEPCFLAHTKSLAVFDTTFTCGRARSHARPPSPTGLLFQGCPPLHCTREGFISLPLNRPFSIQF